MPKALAAAAAALPSPPVLIGHSLGGLVTLMAAARTPVAGVILLAPSPPWGVSGSTMEEAVSAVSLYALGPYWAQVVQPDYASFRRFAVDRLPRAGATPCTRACGRKRPRALRDAELVARPVHDHAGRPGADRRADAGDRRRRRRDPFAGHRARVGPPRWARRFEVMAGMSHWLPGEPGWEAVAARCLAWIEADRHAPGGRIARRSRPNCGALCEPEASAGLGDAVDHLPRSSTFGCSGCRRACAWW